MKEQIKNSMEYRWRLHQSKIYLVIWGMMMAFSLIGGFSGSIKLNSAKDGAFISLAVAAVFSVLLLPLAIYPLVQATLLMKRAGQCSVHTVILDRPQTSVMYRGAVYYTVEFTDNGERLIRDTKPLWSSAPMAQFRLDEYNNKPVKILYDRRSDLVFVLGK